MTGKTKRLYLRRDQLIVKSNLLNMLQKKDMTQAELSEQTGISRGSLSRMRYNTQLRLDFIVRIMEVLNCGFYELFEVIDVTEGRRVTGPRKRGEKISALTQSEIPPTKANTETETEAEKVEG